MDGFTQDPNRGVEVTLMLCDYVDASKGSLTIVGGGPNVTGPGGSIEDLFDLPAEDALPALRAAHGCGWLQEAAA